MLDNQRLTQENITEIKYAKRFGYIFGIIFLCFGLLLSIFFYFELNKPANWLSTYRISIVFASIFITFLFNRKYNKDLSHNEKIIKTDILIDKREEDNYEAGSAMPMPFIQKMKKSIRYYFIIGNTEYNVEKEIYNQVEIGEEVNLHYALCSKMLLEITKN